jgi:hypothetical protein
VTVVVDERDDAAYMQAALHAHQPEQGRITVQPTPANSRPAALAHDVLYALGKRLASGPDAPDARLDSVRPAWLAAAAWSTATGVRHMLVTRAHLVSTPRLEQLLAWRATAGIQLTVLWQTSPRRMPTALARIDRRFSGVDGLHKVLAEPGPIPAHPSFPPAAAAEAPISYPPAAQESPPPPLTHLPPPGAPHIRRVCAGATAAAQLLPPSPGLPVSPLDAAALDSLAHPLIAGALSVLAFTRTTQIALCDVRDIDISGDVSMLRTHSPGHRHCRLHTVPVWARPLLAGARAHHRLAARRPEQELLVPGLSSGARHLRVHAQRLGCVVK